MPERTIRPHRTSYVVVRLLQRFDKLENMEGPGPVVFQLAVSNRSKNGVQVKFHLADPQ